MRRNWQTTAQKLALNTRVMPSGCWEWTGGKTKEGYGQFSLTHALGRTTTTAHRIAYQKAVGPIPKGLFVLHDCDNPACVNPAHLFLGTQKDNIDDMVQKGREKFNRNGRLSDYERNRRFNAVKSGRPLAEIAAECGIDLTSLKRWVTSYSKSVLAGK